MYCIHALRRSESVDDAFDPEDMPNAEDAYPITEAELGEARKAGIWLPTELPVE